ncbi:porin [Limoniibacter endophyticus]|uniref:Porin n=1 Tax=Limoniibacter endophyticus TaxID=1565040 RepID=A0A8J3DPH8_9HYPH|nr:porin [Limoniibacter endophyticus]GHC69156.1 outer membrane protein [Limoniibacter endophyticus]
MNIKSLLLGSAAMVAAVSGARAADAVVFAEPEPMEYVRVCDVYGAGFYYIPGTETCLKIGGYVRYQINASELDNDEGFDKYGRATLGIDARSETELGTLRSFIELRADYTSGGAGAASLRQAFIELGGFKVGVATTINDDALSAEFDSGGYDSRVHMMGYTWDGGNGFTATINLEEYDNNYDYTPNVIARLGVEQGWGGARLYGAYDATAEEWFAKLVGSVNLTERLALEGIATYESGSSVYSVWSNPSDSVAAGNFGYEWSAGALLKYAATEKLSVGFGGQYFASAHDSYSNDTVGTVLNPYAGNDDWALGAIIDYKIVKDFNTKIAINYWDGDTVDQLGEDGYFEGFVRFQRNF